MRLTAKQFAASLFQALDGQPAEKAKLVIKRFVELMAKKNRLGSADKIIGEFDKIWNEKHGLLEAEITSANELDRETLVLLKNYLKERSAAKEIFLKPKIDKNILGGIIIKYGDRVLDGSLKNSLVELKNKLIQ